MKNTHKNKKLMDCITKEHELNYKWINSEKVGAYFQGFAGKTLEFNALGLRQVVV